MFTYGDQQMVQMYERLIEYLGGNRFEALCIMRVMFPKRDLHKIDGDDMLINAVLNELSLH